MTPESHTHIGTRKYKISTLCQDTHDAVGDSHTFVEEAAMPVKITAQVKKEPWTKLDNQSLDEKSNSLSNSTANNVIVKSDHSVKNGRARKRVNEATANTIYPEIGQNKKTRKATNKTTIDDPAASKHTVDLPSLPSKLPAKTQDLISFIFDGKWFLSFENLTESLIKQGFDILDEFNDAGNSIVHKHNENVNRIL